MYIQQVHVVTPTVVSTAAPRSIDVMEYAQARAREICVLRDGLATRSGNRRVHQTLPRHMRRRAMSHNVKRLPVRLRAKASLEMRDTATPAEKGNKSRRWRRRTGNLLQEYARRSRNTTWLETHVWCAKRFHMTSAWGYRLPLRPTDKGFRANYRGLVQACTLHDASYYGSYEGSAG